MHSQDSVLEEDCNNNGCIIKSDVIMNETFSSTNNTNFSSEEGYKYNLFFYGGINLNNRSLLFKNFKTIEVFNTLNLGDGTLDLKNVYFNYNINNDSTNKFYISTLSLQQGSEFVINGNAVDNDDSEATLNIQRVEMYEGSSLVNNSSNILYTNIDVKMLNANINLAGNLIVNNINTNGENININIIDSYLSNANIVLSASASANANASAVLNMQDLSSPISISINNITLQEINLNNINALSLVLNTASVNNFNIYTSIYKINLKTGTNNLSISNLNLYDISRVYMSSILTSSQAVISMINLYNTSLYFDIAEEMATTNISVKINSDIYYDAINYKYFTNNVFIDVADYAYLSIYKYKPVNAITDFGQDNIKKVPLSLEASNNSVIEFLQSETYACDSSVENNKCNLSIEKNAYEYIFLKNITLSEDSKAINSIRINNNEKLDALYTQDLKINGEATLSGSWGVLGSITSNTGAINMKGSTKLNLLNIQWTDAPIVPTSAANILLLKIINSANYLNFISVKNSTNPIEWKTTNPDTTVDIPELDIEILYGAELNIFSNSVFNINKITMSGGSLDLSGNGEIIINELATLKGNSYVMFNSKLLEAYDENEPVSDLTGDTENIINSINVDNSSSLELNGDASINIQQATIKGVLLINQMYSNKDINIQNNVPDYRIKTNVNELTVHNGGTLSFGAYSTLSAENITFNDGSSIAILLDSNFDKVIPNDHRYIETTALNLGDIVNIRLGFEDGFKLSYIGNDEFNKKYSKLPVITLDNKEDLSKFNITDNDNLFINLSLNIDSDNILYLYINMNDYDDIISNISKYDVDKDSNLAQVLQLYISAAKDTNSDIYDKFNIRMNSLLLGNQTIEDIGSTIKILNNLIPLTNDILVEMVMHTYGDVYDDLMDNNNAHDGYSIITRYTYNAWKLNSDLDTVSNTLQSNYKFNGSDYVIGVEYYLPTNSYGDFTIKGILDYNHTTLDNVSMIDINMDKIGVNLGLIYKLPMIDLDIGARAQYLIYQWDNQQMQGLRIDDTKNSEIKGNVFAFGGYIKYRLNTQKISLLPYLSLDLYNININDYTQESQNNQQEIYNIDGEEQSLYALSIGSDLIYRNFVLLQNININVLANFKFTYRDLDTNDTTGEVSPINTKVRFYNKRSYTMSLEGMRLDNRLFNIGLGTSIQYKKLLNTEFMVKYQTSDHTSGISFSLSLQLQLSNTI